MEDPEGAESVQTSPCCDERYTGTNVSKRASSTCSRSADAAQAARTAATQEVEQKSRQSFRSASMRAAVGQAATLPQHARQGCAVKHDTA